MTSPPRILVAEDDPTVRHVVGDFLRHRGYDVALYADGLRAARALEEALPDAAVLDRLLPGLSGDELCRRIKAGSDRPVLLLTALGDVEHRIAGLELGADDYLAKPFSLRELDLRLTALLRRAAPALTTVKAGPFRLDPARLRAFRGDDEVLLTPREYALFLYFAEHPGTVLSRDELMREVWGWESGDASTVTVHVKRLREKLEPEPRFPRHLHTVWGAGYRFTPDEADA